MHATIPKGNVGGFESTVLQRNLKEWHGRGDGGWGATGICLRALKESKALRLDTYSTAERRRGEGRAKMIEVPAAIPNGAEDVSTNSERYLRFPNISLEVDKCSGCEAPNVGTTLPRSHLSHLGEITKQCYRKISPRSRAM